MASDLTRFGLGEMLRCSLGVRRAARGAPDMETAAVASCRYLYDELTDGADGRGTVLVRFYRTCRYDALPQELQHVARSALEAGSQPSPAMRCLTLLATVGQEDAWNDRRASHNHRVIPLASVQMVERAPMIAQLVRSLGIDIAKLVSSGDEIMRDMAGKNYGVFYIPTASGSPHIPAQDFVREYGVRSVVGVGGALPNGDLYAVILFARVPVDSAAADRFRTIALDVKSIVLPFGENDVFAKAPAAPAAPAATA